MLQSLLATPPQLLASGAHEGPRLLARMSRSAACQLARAGRGSIGSAKVEAGTAGAMRSRSISICNMASMALLHALAAVSVTDGWNFRNGRGPGHGEMPHAIRYPAPA